MYYQIKYRHPNIAHKFESQIDNIVFGRWTHGGNLFIGMHLKGTEWITGFGRKIFEYGGIDEGFSIGQKVFSWGLYGQGKVIYESGTGYVGQFQKGVQHGNGKEFLRVRAISVADSSIQLFQVIKLEGAWINGVKQGQFYYVDKNGKASYRIYDGDEFTE